MVGKFVGYGRKSNVLSAEMINCCIRSILLDLDVEVRKHLKKLDGKWLCCVCGHSARDKGRAWEHVEAKHMESGGYTCSLCLKFCPTASSLRGHKEKYHK